VVFVTILLISAVYSDGDKPRMHADRVPRETPKDSIYVPDLEVNAVEEQIFRTVIFPEEGLNEELDRYVHVEFRNLMNGLFNQYKPTNHRFFKNLMETNVTAAVRDPLFISELYKRYQGAMHATRAAVWYSPNLETPRLRQRKAAIIVDDDTVDGEKTHHRQCENLFRWMGADPIPNEALFGDLDTLRELLDADTFAFCQRAYDLYVKSTGAWSIFEVLSDNWQSALYNSLSPHFDEGLREQQYFDEISFGHIEILHMLETVSLTEDILHRKPHLTQETMDDAIEMAEWTYKLWDNFDDLLLSFIKKHSN